MHHETLQNEDIGINKGHTCCSLSDVEDARSVSYKLGMPYYVCNFTEHFKEQVIDCFVNTYLEGKTPNPCIDCNKYMKFDLLYERASILGCDFIATGHYARIEKTNGEFSLKKAVDISKNQSYVYKIDTKSGDVFIGEGKDLFSKELTATDFHWVSGDIPKFPLDCHAKIRYGKKESKATVFQMDESSFRVIFDEPQRAITPGQRVVLYDGDTVLCGGVIDSI